MAPGCICIAASVYKQVRSRLDLAFGDMGDIQVKNISTPGRFFEWSSAGLTTLAICQVRLGQVEEARATIKRILDIAPGTQLATLWKRFPAADALGFDRIAADLRQAGMPA